MPGARGVDDSVAINQQLVRDLTRDWSEVHVVPCGDVAETLGRIRRGHVDFVGAAMRGVREPLRRRLRAELSVLRRRNA